jgi:hypothetical protein
LLEVLRRSYGTRSLGNGEQLRWPLGPWRTSRWPLCNGKQRRWALSHGSLPSRASWEDRAPRLRGMLVLWHLPVRLFHTIRSPLRNGEERLRTSRLARAEGALTGDRHVGVLLDRTSFSP